MSYILLVFLITFTLILYKKNKNTKYKCGACNKCEVKK